MEGNRKWVRELPLHILLIPGVIAVFIFNYIPMFGIVMAFQKFVPAKGFLGSQWIGLTISDIFSTCPIYGM